MRNHFSFILIAILVSLPTALATPAFAQTTRLEESHASISYTGNWQTIAHPSVSGGTIAASRDPGATVTVNFTGTSIAWFGYLCPCGGYADVQLDGGNVWPRNTYDSQHLPQQDILRIDNLTNGPHVLTIRVAGRTDGNDMLVGVDAFEINPTYRSSPIVTITSPTMNAVVSGVLTVTAEATDNAGVRFVRFYAVDRFAGHGGTYSLPYDYTPPYTYTVDTSRLRHSGVYEIWAQAEDYVGDSGLSNRVSVRVSHGGYLDVTNPFIEMTSPANNSTVTGMVTISAAGSDDVGIAGVEFQIGDRYRQTTHRFVDTTAPFSMTVNTSNIPSGQTYGIWAKAWDAAGNWHEASAISVTVQH